VVLVPADGIASSKHGERAQRLQPAGRGAEARRRAIVSSRDAGVQAAGRALQPAPDGREAPAEVAGFEAEPQCPELALSPRERIQDTAAQLVRELGRVAS
jgi:hypothetical protein